MAQRGKGNFVRDLRIGKKSEQDVIAQLMKKGFEIEEPAREERQYYDLKLWCRGEQVCTIEVKYDIMSAQTGNIAIEFFNPKSCKPSGISATKADYYIYQFPDLGFFFTRVNELKKYCEEHQPFRTITAGGDGNASLWLYHRERLVDDIFIPLEEDLN